MFDPDVHDEAEREVESRLRLAARALRPSETLRSEIIGRARQWSEDTKSDGKWVASIFAFACCLSFTLLHARRWEAWREVRWEASSSAGLIRRADEIAVEQRIPWADSMAEAYREQRAALSSHWGSLQDSAN